MKTFTSSLSDEIFIELSAKSQLLSTPKNKIIEPALLIYLDHLERAEYIQSYKRAAKDKDVLIMAEEGMSDYLKLLHQ